VIVECLGVLALHAPQEVQQTGTRLHLLGRRGAPRRRDAKRAEDEEQHGEGAGTQHRN
jgi:hypothetical protein